MGEFITLVSKDGKIKYVLKRKEKITVNEGTIELKNSGVGDLVKTSKGFEFYILKPNLLELYEKFSKHAQKTHLKDLALISAISGISSNSKVLEAGLGTGFSAIFFANLVKPEKVICYEIREDFIEKAKKNIEMAGMEDYIEIKQKDVCKGIEERDRDLIFLDFAEPWKAIKHAWKSLKEGGYLFCYCPNITQVKKVLEGMKEKFADVSLIESWVREWEFDEGAKKILRPKHQALVHTAFLVFGRKVKIWNRQAF